MNTNNRTDAIQNWDKQLLLFLVMLMTGTCFSQQLNKNRYKLDFIFEPQIMLAAYGTVGQEFNAEWDNLNKSQTPAPYGPHVYVYSNRFIYSSGIHLSYALKDYVSFTSGIDILMNQFYRYSLYDYLGHYTGNYQYKIYVWGYAADFLRFPIGIVFNTNTDKKTYGSFGLNTNFDFVIREKILYPGASPGEEILNTENMFVFDRIVPSLSVGMHSKIGARFLWGLDLKYYFRSLYQNDRKFFYYKNQSLGLALSIAYKPGK
jgi:hypothetical protein